MKQGKLWSLEIEWKKSLEVFKINVIELREISALKGKNMDMYCPGLSV